MEVNALKVNAPKKKEVTPRHSASILPIMLEPHLGTIYFLLAKERYHPSWLKGSNLWTDFGGGYQEEDACPEDTAAREFLEETLGQVKFFESDELPRSTHQDIAVSLQEERFLLQFHHGSRITFVVQIPWDPAAPKRFLTCLQDPDAEQWDLCYLEKSMLGLFSIPQVQRAISTKGFLTSTERCHLSLTKTLAVILVELRFHFCNTFN